MKHFYYQASYDYSPHYRNENGEERSYHGSGMFRTKEEAIDFLMEAPYGAKNLSFEYTVYYDSVEEFMEGENVEKPLW